MIKTIVIDLGGVLFTEGKSVAVEMLSTKYGYDKDVVRCLLTSAPSIDLRKGLISDDDFWAWAKNDLPEGYNADVIKKEWYDGYVLDQAIFSLLKRLSATYTIVAFSGNIKSRVEFLDEKYRFRKHLDKEIYSFDHHLDKPQKAFVRVMLEVLGCRPDEIVYIDDEASAAAAAESFGVNVIVYSKGKLKDLEAKLAQLETLSGEHLYK
jgi:FMN phosphatase YigB (HAD superfamily)